MTTLDLLVQTLYEWPTCPLGRHIVGKQQWLPVFVGPVWHRWRGQDGLLHDRCVMLWPSGAQKSCHLVKVLWSCLMNNLTGNGWKQSTVLLQAHAVMLWLKAVRVQYPVTVLVLPCCSSSENDAAMPSSCSIYAEAWMLMANYKCQRIVNQLS